MSPRPRSVPPPPTPLRAPSMAMSHLLPLLHSKHADFVLLAGDMFHENKPSRRTMHSTMSILGAHVFGTEPVFMQLLTNPAEVLKKRQVCTALFPPPRPPWLVIHCSSKPLPVPWKWQANFLDPSLSVSLPVFSIHGNHDDPSREGQPTLRVLSCAPLAHSDTHHLLFLLVVPSPQPIGSFRPSTPILALPRAQAWATPCRPWTSYPSPTWSTTSAPQVRPT